MTQEQTERGASTTMVPFEAWKEAAALVRSLRADLKRVTADLADAQEALRNMLQHQKQDHAEIDALKAKTE